MASALLRESIVCHLGLHRAYSTVAIVGGSKALLTQTRCKHKPLLAQPERRRYLCPALAPSLLPCTSTDPLLAVAPATW
jgi:hypothetical protein